MKENDTGRLTVLLDKAREAFPEYMDILVIANPSIRNGDLDKLMDEILGWFRDNIDPDTCTADIYDMDEFDTQPSSCIFRAEIPHDTAETLHLDDLLHEVRIYARRNTQVSTITLTNGFWGLNVDTKTNEVKKSIATDELIHRFPAQIGISMNPDKPNEFTVFIIKERKELSDEDRNFW